MRMTGAFNCECDTEVAQDLPSPLANDNTDVAEQGLDGLHAVGKAADYPGPLTSMKNVGGLAAAFNEQDAKLLYSNFR